MLVRRVTSLLPQSCIKLSPYRVSSAAYSLRFVSHSSRFSPSLSFSHPFSRPLSRSQHTHEHDEDQQTPSPPPSPEYPNDAWTRFTDNFNELTSRLPRTAAIAVATSRMLSFLIVFETMHTFPALALFTGPELTFGYLFFAATKRLQTPLNMALAPVIAQLFPRVSQFHCSFLTNMVAPKDLDPNSRLARFQNWINGPLDQYGLAYYLAGRVTSVGVVLAVAGALKQGLDIQSYLTYWGVASTAQTEVTLMTGSFLVNSLLVPVHFIGALHLLKNVENTLDKISAERAKKEASLSFKSRRHKQEQKTQEQIDTENETIAALPLYLISAFLLIRLLTLQGKILKTTAETTAPTPDALERAQSYLPWARPKVPDKPNDVSLDKEDEIISLGSYANSESFNNSDKTL